MKNNILVKGLNWTGSSAVIDLLREYENVIHVPVDYSHTDGTGYKKFGEYNFVRKSGGLLDWT